MTRSSRDEGTEAGGRRPTLQASRAAVWRRVGMALAALLVAWSAVASSQAVFDVGDCAGRSGADAVRCLEARCNGEHSDDRSRDLDACVALGWRFACGEGVDVDAANAMDRFSRACDNGHASGCAEYEQLRSMVPLECSTASSATSGSVAGSGTVGLDLGAPCTSASVCASGFCGNGRCAPEGYSYIPAGTFMMGSPEDEVGRFSSETQHAVTLTRAFFMQQTEVTQGQWRALMGNNPSRFSSCGDDCPVETVNWYEALAYANALSDAEGLARCYTLSGCSNTAGNDMGCTSVSVTATGGSPLHCEGYRLPTESEWEYAARAGTATATYRGNLQEPTGCDPQPNLEQIAWYCENAGGSTHPVASHRGGENGWGLHDVLGNVSEWCWDPYGIYPGTVTDPLGATSGSDRVLRGGSWSLSARYARAARRNSLSPGYRSINVGFRLARSVP